VIAIRAFPASFTTCYRKSTIPSHDVSSCFLFDAGAPFVPARNDASCSACAGMQALRAAVEEHIAAGGAPMDIRTARATLIADSGNRFVERVRFFVRTRHWQSNV